MMIVLWVATAALGVWQTYLTATVGNKVMGSLRVRLFGHLQAMELAFFTRTKTDSQGRRCPVSRMASSTRMSVVR